jgi:hypothetical protein
MAVQSRPQPGREAEYNRWYDEVHLGDVQKVPGIVSGRRYRAVPTDFQGPDVPYLAIYEMESDDPNNVLAEFRRRSLAGELPVDDSIDLSSIKIWVYAAH